IPGGGTSPSPFPQALRTPPPTAVPPRLRARSAVLIDLDTGQTLFALDPAERRPIASLTKIMTAYLVLMHARLTDLVTVSPTAASGRIVGVSTLGLQPGERIQVRELLYALLLQSANDAAVALAEHVGGTVAGFVQEMNRAATELGLTRSRFVSPSGLDDRGSSTARDLALLTRAAYGLPTFGGIVATRFHQIPAPAGPPRIVQNRNALLWLFPGATGVKTGFTSAAGFCIVAAADREDVRLLAVVLGAPGEPFSDAAALLDYGFAAFERRSLISLGEHLGTVTIGGRQVPVAAGGALETLVPAGGRVRREIEVDPGVRYPPPRGRAIGSVTLSVSGTTIGRVPLIVTAVPPPPSPGGSGPWWRRAAGAVVEAGASLLRALLSA
ncbi:MAG TPA: D-alanyl-D-alanine carboxypeptidase family protein, partial [Actinomycetota bacterium]|nr:D-alanyl-D-alanine carboxypeptidase family protein [Actinomycetota bacterium]